MSGAELDIFEQQASFGGVWNYSSDAGETIDVPQTNPNQSLEDPFSNIWANESQNDHSNSAFHVTFASPIYENLETNIPHFLMKYSDAPSLEKNQLFPTREAVRKYLAEYGDDIRHLVRFQTQVIDVRQKCQNEYGGWVVQARSLISPGKIYEREYDAVVVANGHYTVPRLPDIKGIREWHKINGGIISHSKMYRRPEPFTNKKVVMVGNSASGIDIASQIATVSKLPVLNSTRSESIVTSASGVCEIFPEISEFLPQAHGERAIRFSDGRVEKEIDAILFCTGYFYSFPFLSSLRPEIISTGDRVQHLYQHIWYIADPTLVFVGLPYKIIPFRTVEGQTAVISRVWSHRLELPSKMEMCKWEEARVAECGNGKNFHTFSVPADFVYYNELIAWASRARREGSAKLPPPWTEKDIWMRKRFPAIKKAFAEKGEQRFEVKMVEDLGFDYDAWLDHTKSHNFKD